MALGEIKKKKSPSEKLKDFDNKFGQVFNDQIHRIENMLILV